MVSHAIRLANEIARKAIGSTLDTIEKEVIGLYASKNNIGDYYLAVDDVLAIIDRMRAENKEKKDATSSDDA